MNRKKICIAMLSILAAVHTGAIIGTFNASAVNTDNSIMQNDYLTLYVGQDEDNYARYQLSANKGNLENSKDDNKNLMYQNFYSSFTTIVINGKTYRYGEGEPISAPCCDIPDGVCYTIQKFGDVEITQFLRFADGMKTGHDDMLLITYSVKNTGTEDVLVGIRIMLDSQLDKDDKCTLTVDNALLNFEKEYKDNIPQTWTVISEDGSVTAYGKVETKPDSIEFADWSSLFNKKWNYIVDSSKDINDSAAALTWNNAKLSAGETKDYSVYYGVKNPASEIIPEQSSTPEKSTPPDIDSSAEYSSNPGNSSKPEKSSPYNEKSIAEGSTENTDSDNSDTFLTGEGRGLFAGAVAAFVLSVSTIIAILAKKTKGGNHDESTKKKN